MQKERLSRNKVNLMTKASFNRLKIELEMLKQYGKRIIIVDIENPKNNIIAKIWNKYYITILKDHGGLFISFSQFKDIINLFFAQEAKIQFKRVATIKGYYMISVIDQKK